MSSPKRVQQSIANQSKDFVWSVQADPEELTPTDALLSYEEKSKIASKTFPVELKFGVPVDLEGSKYAFNALQEGLPTKGNLTKSFAKMKQLDPSNLVDPLNLEDTLVTSMTS